MGFLKEFKTFALKGNVIDMAVGIIIGGAFGIINATGAVEGTETQQDKTGTALIAIIAVAGVAVVVLAVVCIVLVTKKKK